MNIIQHWETEIFIRSFGREFWMEEATRQIMRRWEDNNKIGMKEIPVEYESVCWFQLDRERLQQHFLLNILMNISVAWKM